MNKFVNYLASILRMLIIFVSILGIVNKGNPNLANISVLLLLSLLALQSHENAKE